MIQGNARLLDSEDHWVTDLGKFFPGERVVYRGKDLFTELKDLSWMGLLMYGITGRFFSDQQLRLFEGLWALSISYPDPRLWNNRIAALAGTSRSTTTLGLSAAMAVTEATIYGHRANVRAIDFFLRSQKRLDQGEELATLVKSEMKCHRGIFGYGRPLTQSDERIEPALMLARELALDSGPYLKLAFAVERVLREGRWRMQMNVTGLAAALCADQGLSVREYAGLVAPGFIAGILPCFVDAVDHPEGSFMPLRCSRLEYDGVSPRSWD